MGYPEPLKASIRKLTDDIVTVSCPFAILDKVNVGSRMALINCSGKVVVWSAIPYGPEAERGLELLTGSHGNWDVSHVVIPNNQHTMAAKSFKDKFPSSKIIAMQYLEIPGLDIDYRLTKQIGNRVLDSDALRTEVGITDENILNQFEFVYLPFPRNKDLVMFDKKSKVIFEADVFFNTGVHEPLEQYSPATGYPEGYNPHWWWSVVMRYMQPDSIVGKYLANRMLTPRSRPGLEAISSWDFEKIVMCHGNVIESGAKEKFISVFKL